MCQVHEEVVRAEPHQAIKLGAAFEIQNCDLMTLASSYRPPFHNERVHFPFSALLLLRPSSFNSRHRAPVLLLQKWSG